MEGGEPKQQKWYYEDPMAVKTDAVKGERFEVKLNVPLMSVNTPFRSFLNAALPMDLIVAMV
eukprot:3570068-Pleurochrysis_carterae.AAC.1